MPPAKLWTGNDSTKITVNQGNVAFDSATTAFDSATVNFDGASPSAINPNYTPPPKTWATPNPES